MFLNLHKCELMKRSFQLRHGGRSLVEYYNEMNFVIMELVIVDIMIWHVILTLEIKKTHF